MQKISNFQLIKRAIQALNYCYPNQKIDKNTIIKFLNDKNFYAIYINY